MVKKAIYIDIDDISTSKTAAGVTKIDIREGAKVYKRARTGGGSSFKRSGTVKTTVSETGKATTGISDTTPEPQPTPQTQIQTQQAAERRQALVQQARQSQAGVREGLYADIEDVNYRNGGIEVKEGAPVYMRETNDYNKFEERARARKPARQEEVRKEGIYLDIDDVSKRGEAKIYTRQGETFGEVQGAGFRDVASQVFLQTHCG